MTRIKTHWLNLPCCILAFALSSPEAKADVKPIAVVYAGDAELANVIAPDIRAAGYQIETIGPDVLTNSPALLSRQTDLLVLAGARSLPGASMDAVQNYLRGGGALMAFGLPAWGSATVELNGRWLSKAQCQALIDAQTADRSIVDVSRGVLATWARNCNDADTTTDLSATKDNDGHPAMRVVIDNLTGWDTLVSPIFTNCFPDGRTLTYFRARGSSNTSAMSIEWDEQNGSRWIAVIDLTPEWKSYVLPPEIFHSWESPPGRGGPGDHLDVRHVKRMSIGLARSHSAFLGAHHEFSIGDIGSARSPLGDVAAPDAMNAPQIDTLSPSWKFYPMNGPLKIAAPKNLGFLSPADLQPPHEQGALPWAMHPRPRGVGFNQERPWRWQPLLEARSPEGDYRGALATLMLHFNDEYSGGRWACFTPNDAAFYRQRDAAKVIEETARAIRRGLFLEEGGSEFFTVMEGQDFQLGARVMNFSKINQTDLTVRLRVQSRNKTAKIFEQEWPLSLASGASQTVQQNWPENLPREECVVTTELIQNGKVIDRLEHELNFWQLPKDPAFIIERDGQFWLRGKPWKINGVNYMPSTGIAVTSGNYFEFWLGKGAYDPEAIQRDLDRIKEMGLNAVSVFIYHESISAGHLFDFLRRCEILGLHVNLSLRPGTPLDFQWEQMKDLIERFHMAESDTIFGYDLAWEAEHVSQQHYYGRDWTAWVNARYGSVAKASGVWGVPAPEADATGVLNVPPMRDLSEDGPWRRLSADYRAFLDDELAQKYGAARDLIHSIDPHHAVSFRMSEAGDPTLNSDGRLPFDFYGLARAVDIWEPEAYGRIGDWNRVRDGLFEAAYARLCDPNKPLIWAEMGDSVWDERHAEPSPQKLNFTANFYRDFYRMMTEAGYNGIFFWWYAGGYRANERSDFGIINPDGTDRPVSKIIRQCGPAFLKAPLPPPPNEFIAIDRDRDARGLFGVYQAVKTNYWQAIDSGKIPALKWARSPGAP